MKMDVFKKVLISQVEIIKSLIELAEIKGVTNEQFFIEFEDELNRLSTLNHDKHLNDNKN